MSRRHAVTRGLLAGIAAGMLLFQASPASAHYVYRRSLIFHQDDFCIGSRAEVSHGDGGGYHKADTYSWRRFWTGYLESVPCPIQTSNDPKPPGYIAVGFETFRRSNGQWLLCSRTVGVGGSGWSYNPSTTHQFAVYANNGATTPCGDGTYQTLSHSGVNNGGWQHGSVWSGEHGLHPSGK